MIYLNKVSHYKLRKIPHFKDYMYFQNIYLSVVFTRGIWNADDWSKKCEHISLEQNEYTGI